VYSAALVKLPLSRSPVEQNGVPGPNLFQKRAAAIHRRVDAFDIQVCRLRRRIIESQPLEWPHFRYHHKRSTISSWARTELADPTPLDISRNRRPTVTRAKKKMPIFRHKVRRAVQILPINKRTTTTARRNPNPPAGK
jgi:hypothetical protein